MSEAKPQLLVVDDERDTCANLADIFTDLGYDVDVAYDGPSALVLVEQKVYDVAPPSARLWPLSCMKAATHCSAAKPAWRCSPK
jgi:CheY-like chemotaxis protein